MPFIALLTPAQYRRMPWKNRGGTTLELLRRDHPDDPERFLYRLSIATVKKPGPFSRFPGVERRLMLLEGAGMRLTFGDGRQVCLDKSLEPLAFDGEIEVDCELLDGPIRDFNLMFDRERYAAELEIVELESGKTITVPQADRLLLYVLAGKPHVQSGDEVLLLRAEYLLELENTPVSTLTTDSVATAVVIVIRLKSLV